MKPSNQKHSTWANFGENEKDSTEADFPSPTVEEKKTPQIVPCACLSSLPPSCSPNCEVMP